MWNFILEPEEAGDELEHFTDAPDSDADEAAPKPAAALPAGSLAGSETSKEGAADQQSAGLEPGDGAEKSEGKKEGPASYDMRKRWGMPACC